MGSAIARNTSGRSLKSVPSAAYVWRRGETVLSSAGGYPTHATSPSNRSAPGWNAREVNTAVRKEACSATVAVQHMAGKARAAVCPHVHIES